MKVYISDSCPARLSRYDHNNRAQYFYLLPDLQFQGSNNVLDHLALIITPWINIMEGTFRE
eukprot:7185959-Ditylum_brightwellii.AAC.1